MSHIVKEKRVNQFLPTDKLDIPEGQLHESYGGEELENTIWDIALAKLHTFDTSTWISTTGRPQSNKVPNLILDVIAMWVAGAIYNKQFSEESTDTGDTYGTKLKNDALSLLEGILEGILKVEGLILADDEGIGQPSILETDPAFTMDTVY